MELKPISPPDAILAEQSQLESNHRGIETYPYGRDLEATIGRELESNHRGIETLSVGNLLQNF